MGKVLGQGAFTGRGSGPKTVVEQACGWPSVNVEGSRAQRVGIWLDPEQTHRASTI